MVRQFCSEFESLPKRSLVARNALFIVLQWPMSCSFDKNVGAIWCISKYQERSRNTSDYYRCMKNINDFEKSEDLCFSITKGLGLEFNRDLRQSADLLKPQAVYNYPLRKLEIPDSCPLHNSVSFCFLYNSYQSARPSMLYVQC